MIELKSHWSYSNWNTQNSNPCQWIGVTCDNQQDHVTKLFILISIHFSFRYLNNNQLSGIIPSSIVNLSQLLQL